MKNIQFTMLGIVLSSMVGFLTLAVADDMNGMDMNHGMSQGAARAEVEHAKPNAKAEAAAMSDQMMEQMTTMDADMDHDKHMNMGPGGMAAMKLHMTWTAPRPANGGDQARAGQLLKTLRDSLAKYQDYRIAERDGFKPFHPEWKQKVVHFTRFWYSLKAEFTFNPSEPTSLLYERTDNGYKLIGAMYTAPRRWDENKLNERVPLSVARWHQHVNLCFPKKGTDPKTVDWTKFGAGTIATKEACDAAGGNFFPVLFGWMVHVYPWETDPHQVWAH